MHERMVMLQTRKYEKKGARIIAADLPGWAAPPQVGTHVPDIMVEYQGKVVYNEVETCETILTPRAREQFEESAEWATLHVTVPLACVETAKRIAANWDIKVGMFWAYDAKMDRTVD